jgi:DNA-binding response OmpR family regulator
MTGKKRILAADDDHDLLELLRMVLSRRGYDVLTAENGKDALQIALTEKFDLILLDVMMPFIDGYHLTHEIINKLGPQAPPVLIMTGRDTKRERAVALMSGAHDIIQKPFEMSQLLERAAAALAKSILIVEDDPEYQELAKAILAPLYTLAIRGSAEEAIAALDGKRFNLVLLDINLMGMSGFVVLEKLRQENRLDSLPVLCCSAMSDPETQAQAKTLGASGFVVKPYRQEALLQTISSLVGGGV